MVSARKRAAVEKEDYDTAKALKADIDKLRSATEATNPIMGKPTGVTACSLDDVPVGRPSQPDPAELPAAVTTQGLVSAENLRPPEGTSSNDMQRGWMLICLKRPFTIPGWCLPPLSILE